MNIYDYIDEFGIYSFEEKEFNEVDSSIFAFLSYANLKNIFENNKLRIQDVGRKHLGYHSKREKNITAVREANKLLTYLKDSKRYKDCLVSNYQYEESKDMQFCAITIEYQKNQVYVSFEGTNELFSSWKEDILLSYQFPIESQKRAISYLNKHFTFTNKRLIVGGHSKGGNLALVAGAYANIFVRNKISMIYSFDGPGVLDKEYKSKKYQKALNKYKHFIPDYTIVGLILNNSNNYVVKSTTKTAFCHDIAFLEVKKDKFVRSKLSKFSTKLNEEIKIWLDSYSVTDKMELLENLESICAKVKIHSFLDLLEKKAKILDIIYSSKTLNPTTKKILLDFIRILAKCYNYTAIEELKAFLDGKIKKIKK